MFFGQSERKWNMEISVLYVEEEGLLINKVIGFGFFSGNQKENRNMEGGHCLG